MKIETKFEPGQEVWVMKDNRPIKLFVHTIDICAGLNLDKEVTYGMKYHLVNGSFGGTFKEHEICATKEDLKNRLFG